MGTYELEWIDKHASVGPVFRIGTKDVYSRERADGRILRLRALHSPDMDYLGPAVQAFRELAELWGAPIVFIIDPDVRKPPASRFLYEWSRAAWQNGSVDQSFMVMHNPVTHLLGRLVCRLFCDGGMPFEAVKGERLLAERLDALDPRAPRQGWSLNAEASALARVPGLGDGAYGQLLVRLARRLKGQKRAV